MPRTFADPTFVDDDLDGIPDTLERDLTTSCMIAGRTCAELGVERPEVGTRDYVLVQFGRSGADQDWRLPDDIWADFHERSAAHGWRVQVADLGMRDDLDVRASWSDAANDGRFWFTWLTYDAPSEDTAGWNELNWINLHLDDDPFELLQTLLHEVYHYVLGDLQGGHPRCADDEVGGAAHSDDRASILYVASDCDTEGVYSLALGQHELAPLDDNPFANLHAMNHEGWTELAFEPSEASATRSKGFSSAPGAAPPPRR